MIFECRYNLTKQIIVKTVFPWVYKCPNRTPLTLECLLLAYCKDQYSSPKIYLLMTLLNHMEPLTLCAAVDCAAPC